MAVLLKVRVGSESFPIETNFDLENAIMAIRSQENRGDPVAILINQYYFPATDMIVLEKRVGQTKSEHAREIESKVKQLQEESFDENDDLSYAKKLHFHVTRQRENENLVLNFQFSPISYLVSRSRKALADDVKANPVGYHYLTSFESVYQQILKAIGCGRWYRIILT